MKIVKNAFASAYVLISLTAVSSTSAAICYDPRTPDHHCRIPSPHGPGNSPTGPAAVDLPVAAVELIADSGSIAANDLTYVFRFDIPNPGIETATVAGQQITGIWTNATTSTAQRASRVAALQGMQPLRAGEFIAFVFSADGMSYIATAEARRLHLPLTTISSVTSIFGEIANLPRAASTINLHLAGLPCPIDGTIDVVEQASVSGGVVHANRVGQSTSYNPGEIACDTILDPALIATFTAATESIVSAEPAPVLGSVVPRLPVCLPVSQTSIFLDYTRAEVSGSLFYFAATVGSGSACGGSWCACSCVNHTTDNANCGSCGLACGGGTHCVGGACVCPPGDAVCGGSCVELGSDPRNCGDCGHACASGQICRSDRCQLPSRMCPRGTIRCSCSGNDWCTSPQLCQRVCGRTP